MSALTRDDQRFWMFLHGALGGLGVAAIASLGPMLCAWVYVAYLCLSCVCAGFYALGARRRVPEGEKQ